MLRNKKGFTIVELLIVIVVIGVLAVITLVIYNGIQTRAENARVISSMDAYEKILRSYKIDHGRYPLIDGNETGDPTWACLGRLTDYPAATNLPAGACIGGTSGSTISFSSTLTSLLKPYASTLPSGRAPVFSQGNGYIDYRGILYSLTTPDAHQADIFYVISNEQTCGRGEKVYYEGDESTSAFTQCIVKLP